jgi:hypothetical protein
MEKWKFISEFGKNYKISNYGKVFSVRRNIIMKSCKNRDGYHYMNISINRKRKKLSVHRSVAEAFIANDFNKPFVNHIDNNPSNNHEANLEWCTNSENIQHAIDNGFMKTIGENNPMSKLSRKDVDWINSTYVKGKITQSEIAGKFNVSRTTISHIINKKRWSKA